MDILIDISGTIIWFINTIHDPENIPLRLFIALFWVCQFLLDIPLVRRLRRLHLKKRKLDIMKKIMENKDLYTISVEDPTTGEEVKWPIIHLGNIDQFSTIENLDEFAKNLTEEEKEKQRVNTEQFLLKLSEKREC